MLVNKAYKFRIYPNKQQEVLINKTFGCCRLYSTIFLLSGTMLTKKQEKDCHTIWISKSPCK